MEKSHDQMRAQKEWCITEMQEGQGSIEKDHGDDKLDSRLLLLTMTQLGSIMVITTDIVGPDIFFPFESRMGICHLKQ